MTSEPIIKRRKPNTNESAGYSIESTTSTRTASTSTQQPQTPPASAPISALQARRAAQEAAAALLPPPLPASDFDESDTDEVARALASSSSDDEGEQSAVNAAQAKLAKRKAKLDKAKGKSKQAGRYFAGGGEEGGERIGAAAMEVDGQPPHRQAEEGKKVKMGRGKRQRREKSAFVDPTCFSAFQPSLGHNAYKLPWGGFVFCLARNESLIIHGSFQLTPLSGAVSTLSSVLTAPASTPQLASPPLPSLSTHRVFAPSSHPLPITFALPRSQPPSPIALPSGQTIETRDFDAVVLVSPLNADIEGVEKPLKAAGLGGAAGMWESEGLTTGWGDKGWQLILEPTPSLTSVRMPEGWGEALEALVPTAQAGEEGVVPLSEDRLVLMVEGPKRVGKSTFARLLLNRLLAKYEQVAYLDTDLGQPEFSPPGFVSLSVLDSPVLGPSFTHPTLPPFSHYLGALSPASDPAAYNAAVSALIASYSLSVEFPARDGHSASGRIRDRVPLVVNTQGWVKGLGADLLAKLRQEAMPTHVFSFDAPEEQQEGGGGWSPEMMCPDGVAVWRLPAAPSSPLDSKWSASDLRTLSLVSYFHAVFPSPVAGAKGDATGPATVFPSKWNFNLSLVSQPPLAVNWKVEAGMLSSVHVLGGEVAYEHILHALNGAIVGLVATPPPADATPTPTPSTAFPYIPYAPPPHPTQSRALGLAVVRAVVPESQVLQLLTPVPAGVLAGCGAVGLVLGAVELPLPLMLDFNASEVESVKGVCGVAWKDVPFLSVEEGEGGGRRRVRRNLMRRGQN